MELQVWVSYEGGDGVPVIEDFAGQSPGLFAVGVLIEETGSLETGEDGVDAVGCCGVRGPVFRNRMDQSAHFTHEPLAEAGSLILIAVDERDPFSDQVCDTALTTRKAAIGAIAIAEQDAEEGVADEITDRLGMTAGDPVDRRGRTQHAPEAARLLTLLGPRGLIGVDHARGAQRIDEAVHDRLAGQARFADAPIDAADGQADIQPGGQELGDFCARHPIAHRQCCDEGRQARPHQAGLAGAKLVLAPLDDRDGAGECARGRLGAAGAGDGEVAVLHAGHTKAGGLTLQIEHQMGAGTLMGDQSSNAAPHRSQ